MDQQCVWIMKEKKIQYLLAVKLTFYVDMSAIKSSNITIVVSMLNITKQIQVSFCPVKMDVTDIKGDTRPEAMSIFCV